jgi:hypothetical protein
MVIALNKGEQTLRLTLQHFVAAKKFRGAIQNDERPSISLDFVSTPAGDDRLGVCDCDFLGSATISAGQRLATVGRTVSEFDFHIDGSTAGRLEASVDE